MGGNAVEALCALEPVIEASGLARWEFEPGDPALGRAIAGERTVNGRKAAAFRAALDAFAAAQAAQGWIADKAAAARGPVSFMDNGGCAVILKRLRASGGGGEPFLADDPEWCGERDAADRLADIAPEPPSGWEKIRVSSGFRKCACQTADFKHSINRRRLERGLAAGAAGDPSWFFIRVGKQPRRDWEAILPLLPASWDAMTDCSRGKDDPLCAQSAALSEWLSEKCGEGGFNERLTRCCAQSGGAFTPGAPFWIIDPRKGPRSLSEADLAAMDWGPLAAALDAAGVRDLPAPRDSGSFDPSPLEKPLIRWDADADAAKFDPARLALLDLEAAVRRLAEESAVLSPRIDVDPEDAAEAAMSCVSFPAGSENDQKVLGALLNWADRAYAAGLVELPESGLESFARALIRGCAAAFAAEALDECRRILAKGGCAAADLRIRACFRAYNSLPAPVRREMEIRFGGRWGVEYLVEKHALPGGDLSDLARWAKEQARAEVIPAALLRSARTGIAA